MEKYIYNINNLDAKMKKLIVKWCDRAGSMKKFKTIHHMYYMLYT